MIDLRVMLGVSQGMSHCGCMIQLFHIPSCFVAKES